MPARDSLRTCCYFICEKKRKAANLSNASAAVKRLEQSRVYWTLLLLKAKKLFSSFSFSAVACRHSEWQDLRSQVLGEFPTTVPCNGTTEFIIKKN